MTIKHLAAEPNLYETQYITTFNQSTSQPSIENHNLVTFQLILICILLILIILASIFGNILVVIAVTKDRHLRKRCNSLYISLAFADLCVSVLVMPFAVFNLANSQKWVFGIIWCNFWISLDVMACTSSILNMAAIALDRYLHVSDPFHYEHKMSVKVFIIFIGSIWLASVLISFPPVFLGLHLPESQLNHNSTSYSNFSNIVTNDNTFLLNLKRNFLETHSCAMDLNRNYAIVSSMFSFFIPCAIMLILYFKLFMVSRKLTKNSSTVLTPIHQANHRATSTTSHLNNNSVAIHSNGSHHAVPSKVKISDYKAAVTLGVLMGTFLICWLPFFILNVATRIMTACEDCYIDTLMQLATWLGYLNSCVNPAIYSVFNKEFRFAFKKLLLRRQSSSIAFPFNNFSDRQERLTYRKLAAKKKHLLFNGSQAEDLDQLDQIDSLLQSPQREHQRSDEV